jgi:hypothetical protein
LPEDPIRIRPPIAVAIDGGQPGLMRQVEAARRDFPAMGILEQVDARWSSRISMGSCGAAQ